MLLERRFQRAGMGQHRHLHIKLLARQPASKQRELFFRASANEVGMMSRRRITAAGLQVC